MTKKVNWRSTLQSFTSMAEDRGIELVFIGNKDIEMGTKGFTPTEGEARHGILSGADEGTDYTKTDADNAAKAILEAYYSKLQPNGVNIPFRLHPVVDTKTGSKPHQTYYIGQPTATNSLKIKNAQHKTVSGEALKGLMKTVRWMDTFNGLIQGLEDIETYIATNDDQITKRNLDANLKYLNEILKANSTQVKSRVDGEFDEDPLKNIHDASKAVFQKYGEAQKRYEDAKQTVKGTNSKAARSALKAAQSAMKATKSVYQAKAKAYSDEQRSRSEIPLSTSAKRRGGKLIGRGLRGAGVKPLEGVHMSIVS
ncbi:hypothetical protein PC110_g22757 [Phytophthora cactorum]|uniref:Uncharacterized protein n=1 Tax=Phytophthora cactorum TaxID=29920 RepID=A0A329R8P2_9STRA|nr:hypothetical protein PC110_g22757 [Phytophthora cactorum]